MFTGGCVGVREKNRGSAEVRFLAGKQALHSIEDLLRQQRMTMIPSTRKEGHLTHERDRERWNRYDLLYIVI